ncbi:MAG: hypothetical protein RIE24_06480 [Silicimonas sp.]
MTRLGHNNGPTMEKGGAWRRYAWTRARAELLPTLPIEVARRRVRRARELGIDYKAYAGIRAATGRDIVALLFSCNALRLLEDDRIEAVRAERLATVRQAEFLALVHPPHDPARTTGRNPLILAADKAPGLVETWRETRQRILALKGTIPADGIVVVGETHLERGWTEAARLAGYIRAERYFA